MNTYFNSNVIWLQLEYKMSTLGYIEYGQNISNQQKDWALESVLRPNVLKAPDF